MTFASVKKSAAFLLVLVIAIEPALAQKPAPARDWSRSLVDSTLQRNPDAKTFGGWGYAKALYLLGQYYVYERTHEKRYLDYITTWLDQHIDENGKLDREINALDYIFPAVLTVVAWQETHNPRYKLAAETFRKRFDDYPRTSDGGFWHATIPSRQWQLWADGAFMGMEFLIRYGQAFGDAEYCNNEAAKQILVYASHLKDPKTGLLFHAYDESGKQPWADPTRHHSAEFWGRAMGWFVMVTVDLLDVLPKNHPKRAELVALIAGLVKSLAKYQDPKTGLWYQVVDKGTVEGNWLETSESSMYTYATAVAVKRGYVDKSYKDVADRGYRGVLSKLAVGDDGLVNISDIGEGTNVSDLAYYFARKRNVNDFHGLGAFLLLNEEHVTGVASLQTGKRKLRK